MNYYNFQNNYEWFTDLDSDLTTNFSPKLMDFWLACQISRKDAENIYESSEKDIENDMNKITNYDDMILSKIEYEDMTDWLNTFLWRTNYRTNGYLLQGAYYTWIEETLGLDVEETESKGLKTKFMELYKKNDLRKLTKEEEEEVKLMDKQYDVNEKLKQIDEEFKA